MSRPGVKTPRLSRDILIYGLGEVAIKAFGLVTLPIYTRIFSTGEFGTLSVVLTVAGFLLAIVALGGDSAFVRYFLATTDEKQRRRITSTWIGFLGAWSLIVTAALLPFTDAIGGIATGGVSAGTAVLIAFLFTPIRLINVMCGQVLRNEFRAWHYAGFNLATVILTISASLYGAVALELGVLGVLIGTLVAEIAILPIRLYSVRHMLGLDFSGSDLKGLLAYGVPLVPTSLAYWVFTTSDRVLISNLSAIEQVGLYSVAVSLVSVAMISVMALGQAWNPHAVRAFTEDPARAARLFSRMFTYIIAGFGVLAVALTAFAPELIGLIAGGDFRGASRAILPLSIGMLAYASTQVTAGGISMQKRTVFLALYAWVAAAINAGLNLLLIPPYGMVGAAWATAAAYVSLTGAYMLTSHRLWPYAYEWNKVGLTLGVVGVSLVGGSLLPDASHLPLPNLMGLIAVKFALCAALVGALLRIGALDAIAPFLRSLRRERVA